MNTIPSICRRLSAICLLMVLFLTSCSKDASEGATRRADLISEIPDDMTITVAFSPAAILNSAGMEVKGDAVKPSKSIERLVASNSSLKNAVDFITNAKGIDYSAAVVAGGTDNGYVLFALSDAKKFCDWAEGEGMTVTDSGNYVICYKNIQTPAIVVDGLTAWFIGSAPDADKALSIVENNKSAAAANKIAAWKTELLIKDDINVIVNVEAYSKQMTSVLNNLGMADMAGLAGSLSNIYNFNCKYSSSNINFDGPSLKMSGEAYTADGQPTPVFAKDDVNLIPSSALALVKDSQVAFSIAFPKCWQEIMAKALTAALPEQNNAADIVIQCMNAMKSITFGIATRDGFSIANAKPSDISANLIIGYYPDQAEKAYSLLLPEAKKSGIGGAFEEGWNAFLGKSTYTISPEPTMPDLKIYLTGKDQMAFFSDNPDIQDMKLSADPKLEGLIAYTRVDLKKSHPALSLTNCPFGVESVFTSTNEKSEGYITLTETDGPILETLITFISRFL